MISLLIPTYLALKERATPILFPVMKATSFERSEIQGMTSEQQKMYNQVKIIFNYNYLINKAVPVSLHCSRMHI